MTLQLLLILWHNGAICAAGGVVCSFIGAVIAGRGAMLSQEEALAIGLGTLASIHKEENLRLPSVRTLLRQTRLTRIAIAILTIGTAFQLYGIWQAVSQSLAAR